MDSILETYFLGTLADKEEMVEYIQTDTGPNTDRQTDRQTDTITDTGTHQTLVSLVLLPVSSSVCFRI